MNQDSLEYTEIVALLKFVIDLAEVLADHKEEVTIEAGRTFDGCEVILRVAPEDLTSIAGYKGKTLAALRHIASALGAKAGVRAVFSLESGYR